MMSPAQEHAVRESIRKQARAALTAGIVSLLFFGIVFGPGALIRAALVRKEVALHNLGHEHLTTAKSATILGAIGLGLVVVKAYLFFG
jgi:hypothetical protein